MKKISLLTLFVTSSIWLSAQTITGIVLNEGKKPLPFANIYSNERTNHTHANDDGTFEIKEAKIGDTIIISHVGFTTQKIIIKNLQNLRILLNRKSIQLKNIVIEKKTDALNLFSDVNLQTSPVQNAQEVLLKVPGLLIGQHAGGGKAEQIFLRGFDIDHGTDVGITLENMPVNMVSHAHGQGYADMHFIIPETISKINFNKGPYDADRGNFSTAGSVDLQLRKKLDQNLVKIEGGQFNSKRILGMFNVLQKEKQQAYIASSFASTDGPFESSQNFSRYNFMARYNAELANQNTLTVSASHFTSKWDASGQIPQRAVNQSSISRFGAIDDTEGGKTTRSNLWLEHTKLLTNNSYIKSNLYATNYTFQLFSNFTFFLNDSVNGDQIKQEESRNMVGGQIEYGKELNIAKVKTFVKTGMAYRNDQSNDNELSRTKNRKTTLEQIQFGDVDETNLSAYANAEIEIGDFLIQPGLRVDQFRFAYLDRLQTTYNPLSQQNIIVSPKLNILYNYKKNLQFYLKTGKGFHSNDSRVVINQLAQKNIPAAYGADLGFIWKARKNLFINVAAWHLYLEQEFVYVGDEGIVEPSGETSRQGIDVSIRYQPKPWIYFNADANYAHARAINEASDENFIPLAPSLTAVGNLQLLHPSGWFGGLRCRHMGDRAANETNSIVADGYTVFDGNLGYRYRSVECGVKVQNVFNTDWNETQFATTSRLRNEVAPVEEIHFTPGTPFNLSAYLSFRF